METKLITPHVPFDSDERKLSEVREEEMASSSRLTADISSDTFPFALNSEQIPLSSSCTDTSISCTVVNVCHLLNTSNDATPPLESPIFEEHPKAAFQKVGFSKTFPLCRDVDVRSFTSSSFPSTFSSSSTS